MLEDYDLFLTQFVTLWAVLEPVSHLSMFVATTAEMPPVQRRKTALLCCFFAFLILVFFAVAGRALLDAMHVSVLSFQIAGGLILFIFATGMIFSDPHPAPTLDVDADKNIAALAVYPLAIPIIAGPGAILSVVILADNNRGVLEHQAVTISVLALLMGLMAVLFFLGDYVLKLIGSAGANLIRRIMGLVLAALSVDIVLTALARWLHLPPI
ncbi:MarC family protein [Xanthobacter sp. VTT E-85241]|uniref:MarC family protein n=1 Tax=Roseixanthobacter finlandensis TaxID=3119922 RepID=UPI0037264D6A